MASLAYTMTLLVVVVLLSGLVAGDEALSCWRCSSQVSNGKYCNDPFHPENITPQLRNWSYEKCTHPTAPKSGNVRSMCKKLVQEVYGKLVMSRSCFYMDVNDQSDGCDGGTNSSDIKILSCETCSTDGCNGAVGHAPWLALVVASAMAGAALKLFK